MFGQDHIASSAADSTTRQSRLVVQARYAPAPQGVDSAPTTIGQLWPFLDPHKIVNHVPNDVNATLKAAFEQEYNVMLENGLDLAKGYIDEDPSFLHRERMNIEDIGKCTKT
jgi:hypothetical protein